MAAPFSAELCDRQAHHTAFHQVFARRPRRRVLHCDRRRGRADGRRCGDFRQPPRIRKLHGHPRRRDGTGDVFRQGAGGALALALIDCSIIGASAVSLASAYAIADVLKFKHSLHRKPTEAKMFYAVYAGLLVAAAALVLTPGVPLGLITNAVQGLAGVLLPSATVFLLLLCNDRAVLGPWVNGRWINILTGTVIAVMGLLSIILTAAVLHPKITGEQILTILIGGSVIAIVAAIGTTAVKRWRGMPAAAPIDRSQQVTWRMPPLSQLPPGRLTPTARGWMG